MRAKDKLMHDESIESISEDEGSLLDLVLDGTLCSDCGGMVYGGDPNKAKSEDVSPGYPRKCEDCEGQNNEH